MNLVKTSWRLLSVNLLKGDCKIHPGQQASAFLWPAGTRVQCWGPQPFKCQMIPRQWQLLCQPMEPQPMLPDCCHGCSCSSFGSLRKQQERNRRGAGEEHGRPACDGTTGGHLAGSEAATAQQLGCISPYSYAPFLKGNSCLNSKRIFPCICFSVWINKQPFKPFFSSPLLFPYSLVEVNISVTKVSLSIKRLLVRFSKLQVRWHWFVLGFFLTWYSQTWGFTVP